MQQFFDTLQDINGNALTGLLDGITVLAFPGGGATTIYSDNGLTTQSSTVQTDSTGQVSFYAPDGDYIIQYKKAGTLFKTRSPVNLFDGPAQVTFNDSGVVNAYATGLNSALEKVLRAGLRASLKITNTNTGASTFAYNGLAAKNVVYPGGGAFPANTLLATGIYQFEYDGTSWQIRNSQASPFYPTTIDEVTAAVTIVNPSFPPMHVSRYGTNTVQGTTDMTTAFLAAMTVAFVRGGTVTVPAETLGITSVVFNWTASKSVNIQGQGEAATTLVKIGASTTPILDFSVDIGVLNIYSAWRDFAIVGNAKTHHGLRMTRIASVDLENIKITACDSGLESVGSLACNYNKVDFNSNNVGFRSRKNTVGGTIFANAVNFFGGSIRANSSFGFDIGDASGVTLWGVDIELNGTTTNTATGGVIIRQTVDDEFGGCVIEFVGCWWEANFGWQIQVEAATALTLSFKACQWLASEANRVGTFGAIRHIIFEGCQAIAPGDAVVIGACAHSSIKDCNLTVTSDTSTNQTRLNWTNSGGTVEAQLTGGLALVGSSPFVLDITAKMKGSGGYTDNATYMSFVDGAVAGNLIEFSCTNGAGGNAAGTSIRCGRSGTTARSINAGGTVNINGADYAEYETKREDCGPIAKGDVVGFDQDGLLTDRFDLAVSFGIKSTEPSLVGGDNWFTEARPPQPAENATVDQVEAWNYEVEAFEARLEAARARVDRIAYCGKVPVNLQGAKPGQYISARRSLRGAIEPLALSAPDGTCLGRVRSVMADGRPLVVVRT